METKFTANQTIAAQRRGLVALLLCATASVWSMVAVTTAQAAL